MDACNLIVSFPHLLSLCQCTQAAVREVEGLAPLVLSNEDVGRLHTTVRKRLGGMCVQVVEPLGSLQGTRKPVLPLQAHKPAGLALDGRQAPASEAVVNTAILQEGQTLGSVSLVEASQCLTGKSCQTFLSV